MIQTKRGRYDVVSLWLVIPPLFGVGKIPDLCLCHMIYVGYISKRYSVYISHEPPFLVWKRSRICFTLSDEPPLLDVGQILDLMLAHII